jgi:hypothetical protein
MDAITSIEKFLPEFVLNQSTINSVLVKLSALPGIKTLNVEKSFVRVVYYQDFLSSAIVKDALVRAGFPFAQKKNSPKFIRKLILKMGEENNKEFGGKPPKCCGK